MFYENSRRKKIKMEEEMFISHSTAVRDPQIQFLLKSLINMFSIIFQTMYYGGYKTMLENAVYALLGRKKCLHI